MFSLRLCGFSPGTSISSHSPKTWIRSTCSFKLPIGVNLCK